MRYKIISTLMTLFVSTASANEELTLTVLVEGATPNKGQIITTVFGSAETYMKEPMADRITTVDETGQVRATFEALAPGDYAISVIYDEDSDGELDTNFLGIPTEQIGFSNNAKGRFGPASYEKARFVLAPGETEISIALGAVDDD